MAEWAPAPPPPPAAPAPAAVQPTPRTPRSTPLPRPAPRAAAEPVAPPALAAAPTPGPDAPEPALAPTAEPLPAPAPTEAPADPRAAEPAAPAATAAPADDPLQAGVVLRAAGSTEDRPATALPTRLAPPTRLGFEVTGQSRRMPYTARAELVWQHDGERYTARQQVSALFVGTRSQQSTGRIGPAGLEPERFADRSRSEQAAHFDPATGRVTFSANTPPADVGRQAQDRLSLFLQLGAWIAADPARFGPGTQITVTAVSARAADRWTFTVEGEDTLQLDGAPLPALRLTRLPRKEYDQKAELWLAPALGYLPARIRLTQANGDHADLQLRSHGAP